MNENGTKIQAVIFDLDGTVLANEYVYGEAFRNVLKTIGVETDEDYPHIGGIGVEENWPILLDKYEVKKEYDIKDLTRKTQQQYLGQVDEVELKEGFLELVQHLRDHEIVTALATSNEWWIVEEIMEKFDLGQYFDTITTAEEVVHKKPDPELFLITARKLGVEYDDCLVFEDSEAGIKAAKEAGMMVVGVARDEEHEETLNMADFIINNFTEISPDLLTGSNVE